MNSMSKDTTEKDLILLLEAVSEILPHVGKLTANNVDRMNAYRHLKGIYEMLYIDYCSKKYNKNTS